MLAAGLKITINSDGPGYMQNVHMTENLAKAQSAADLLPKELVQIHRSAFEAP